MGSASEDAAANANSSLSSAEAAGRSARNVSLAGPTEIVSPSDSRFSATAEPFTRTPSSDPAAIR